MYFKACGTSLLWNWLLKLIFTINLFKIASKLTSIVTILVNIVLAGDHIFQVLGQYSWVLPQYLRVFSQYLQVLSRWIGPWYVWTCLGMSRHFQACTLYRHVQAACTGMSRQVQACPDMSRHVQACQRMSRDISNSMARLVQACTCLNACWQALLQKNSHITGRGVKICTNSLIKTIIKVYRFSRRAVYRKSNQLMHTGTNGF